MYASVPGTQTCATCGAMVGKLVPCIMQLHKLAVLFVGGLIQNPTIRDEIWGPDFRKLPFREPDTRHRVFAKSPRPHKRKDPTSWLEGPGQGGFQKPWLFVGSRVCVVFWAPTLGGLASLVF